MSKPIGTDDLVRRLHRGPSMLAQEEAADRIEKLEAKLAKAVRLMELSVELATWNTTLLQDVIDFITELKGQGDE